MTPSSRRPACRRLNYLSPTSLALLRVLKHMLPALRKHAAKPTDYSGANPSLGGTVGLHDPALNFFLRTILEGEYRTVVEIGAYSGSRILALKRMVPTIDAWALDIIPAYSTPSTREGVNFERYDDAFFDKPLTAAVVCARGTLAVMSPDQLNVFLRRLAERRIDLAFCEPVAYRPLSRPLLRTRGSYYHPYDRVLRDAGFAPQSTLEDSTRFAFNLSMMEAWCTVLARAPR